MSLVIVSYHITTHVGLDRDKDNEIQELAKSLGGKFVGSGSGFGHRDLEFEFTTHFQANDFIKKCRILGLEISNMED
jgi:hypothetical protein